MPFRQGMREESDVGMLEGWSGPVVVELETEAHTMARQRGRPLFETIGIVRRRQRVGLLEDRVVTGRGDELCIVVDAHSFFKKAAAHPQRQGRGVNSERRLRNIDTYVTF